MNRVKKSVIIGLCAGMATSTFVPSAFGQANRSQFGTITAKADRSVTTLGKEVTTTELSGGVSVQTDRGDIMTAQNMSLVLAVNPATKKLDAKTVTASGGVRLKTVETITPSAGGAAYKRVINVTAGKVVFNNFDNTAVLTGNVSVVADDPMGSYAWRNAARATLNLTTKHIEANAADGEKINVEITPKG